MDMQAGNNPLAAALASTAAQAVAAARTKGCLIIYVVIGFRPGAPEAGAHNKIFGHQERFARLNMADFMQLSPGLTPQPDELIVTKRRVSAFTGSDLEVVLRASGIQHLVLAGIATSGVVLSTLREAADKDYGLTVLADACGDADEEVHRVLTTKVFPRQAEVVTVAEWAGEA